MKLSEVWLSYAADRLGREPDPVDSETLTPSAVEELLWDFNSLFEGRRSVAIEQAEPESNADENADAALCALAINDSFDHWPSLSPATLGALRNRHARVLMVAEINRQKGTLFMSRIPRGLDPTSRARTVWLQLMLHGRE